MTIMQISRTAVPQPQQQPQQHSFSRTLTRASLLPMILFLTVLAYVVPSAILNPAAAPADDPSPVIWKSTYSERYPGCVSTVLWPAAEVPTAVLVMRNDGEILMVSREQSRTLAVQGQVAQMIGICRAPR